MERELRIYIAEDDVGVIDTLRDFIEDQGLGEVVGSSEDDGGDALQIAALQRQVEDAKVKLGLAERVFAAGTSGDVVHIARGTRPAPRQRSSAVVLYRQRHQSATADDTKPQR